jgi:predicted  nucleic acid-binding Zn-ribbon protein
MLWDTRFREHELWTVVEQARATMNSTVLPESAAERDALDYVGMVLELLEQRRNETDARQISPAMLNSTQSAASNFSSYLSQAKIGQYTWAQVAGQADEVLTSLAQWPPMKLSRYLAGVNGAVESFQRRTLEAADAVEERALEIRKALGEIDAKQTKLASTIDVERQRITEAIATFTSEGDEAVREWTDAHENTLKQRIDRWDEQLESARTAAAQHNTRMDEYEAKSRKVLEAVGVNATATDFGVYANDQRDTANTWRIVAVLVFVVAGGWFIASSFPWFTDGARVWESALARLGVTAAVAAVGLYAARESSQHRQQERRAKQVQLVLTALEPFIANLPTADQDKLRVSSAEAIFVLAEAPASSSDDDTTNRLLSLANSLAAKFPDRA